MSGEGSVPAPRAWLIQNRLMHVMCNALPTRAKRHTAGVSEVLVIWCWFTQGKGAARGCTKRLV